jgi:CO/xanthine dehydrogenase FAD-binding subunit
MRSHLPSFTLRRAVTLNDAVALMAQKPGTWRPFAGGTDLMVQLAAGTLLHREFVSIWGIEELRRIEVAPDAVTLGALVTFTDVLRHDILQAEFPLLCRAAAETGGIANQNRGTVGGNVANASPAADTPPALLVYDAQLELISSRGRRRVSYEKFHTGYKEMDLAADELIASIILSRRASAWTQHYRKVGARRAQAISKVCFAAAAQLDGRKIVDVRLAFASVAPTVVRATSTEAMLRGGLLDPRSVETAVKSVASELTPIDDIRSTARYRLRVAQNLLAEFLRRLDDDVR